MNKKITGLFTMLMLLVPSGLAFAQSCFTDTEGHAYEDAICGIKEMGVVQGYGDGSYKPNETINRAEFTKIIISIKPDLFLDALPSSSGFSDVGTNAWYFPYVMAAKNSSVIGGYPDGSFRPANSINLAEALKIILETFDVELVDTEGEWYEKYIVAAYDLGILTGLDVDPGMIITRGEMAQMVFLLAYYSLGYDEEECIDGTCDDEIVPEEEEEPEDELPPEEEETTDVPDSNTLGIPGFESISYGERMCTDAMSSVVNPCVNEYSSPCQMETPYYAIDKDGYAHTYGRTCEWGSYNTTFEPCESLGPCYFDGTDEAVDNELGHWVLENDIWTLRGYFADPPVVE